MLGQWRQSYDTETQSILFFYHVTTHVLLFFINGGAV